MISSVGAFGTCGKRNAKGRPSLFLLSLGAFILAFERRLLLADLLFAGLECGLLLLGALLARFGVFLPRLEGGLESLEFFAAPFG